MERLSYTDSPNTVIGTDHVATSQQNSTASVATNQQRDAGSTYPNAMDKKPYISHQPDSHGHIH